MVERFDVAIKHSCGSDPYAVMVSDPDGPYVMASDYDAARAEIERLKASNEELERLRGARDADGYLGTVEDWVKLLITERDEARAHVHHMEGFDCCTCGPCAVHPDAALESYASECWNDPQCEADAEYIPNAILAEMEKLK